jgi:uroporphyrinogen-III synthase
MRVLVTRGRAAAARTAEKLAAMGHDAIVSPVLEIAATDAVWPSGIIDALIATSAQAFEFLKADDERPPPETRRLLPLFLVGERTAAAARAGGFEGPAVLALDGKDLARQILERPSLPKRMLYLAGHDRKNDLEDRLGTSGLKIDVLETYEARAAASLAPEVVGGPGAGGLDAVLHYSRRSAAIFLDLATSAGLDAGSLLHMAISEDAATPLRDAHLARIAVAAEPRERSVLALLDALSKLPFGQTGP